MLQFDLHKPEGAGDGSPLIVLLHGRGSDKGNLMKLQPHLPPQAVVAAPRAPFPSLRWGYGPGWAWYRFLGRNRPEPETFEKGQNHLHTFLEELPERLGFKPGRLILGGFSQGATMSTAYALRHPGTLDGVLHFSGFVADHPTVVVERETVRDTSFLWIHGTEDPIVPFALAIEGRELLKKAGAELTVKDYPIGHSIGASALEDAREWLNDLLG